MAELKAGEIAICIDAADCPSLEHGAAYEVLQLAEPRTVVRRVARIGELPHPEIHTAAKRFRCHG